jgi:hypothetical protein
LPNYFVAFPLESFDLGVDGELLLHEGTAKMQQSHGKRRFDRGREGRAGF